MMLKGQPMLSFEVTPQPLLSMGWSFSIMLAQDAMHQGKRSPVRKISPAVGEPQPLMTSGIENGISDLLAHWLTRLQSTQT